MYKNNLSKVRVDESYTYKFGVKIVFRQCLVANTLLFVKTFEALSHEFRNGYPWEMLYSGDFAVIVDHLWMVWEKNSILERWNNKIKKILISRLNLNTLEDSSKLFTICSHWALKKYSGLIGKLKQL